EAAAGIEDAYGSSGLSVPTGAFPGTVRFASPGALPPGAPKNLSVVARSGQPFLIDVRWEPPDDESGSVLSYDVRRSLAAEDELPELLHQRFPGTWFVDEIQRSCRCRTGGAGDVYWYTVRATNVAGEGPGSRACVRASAPATAAGCTDILLNGVAGS
ncbi:MAG TPA: fibronectin type III domain-containing protein, partial [Candidatus Thermoplasmatota archaeon]|nr:fibronectin type III domain-containing protein [Candidatus Thermoplasmatota archaeon]